MPKYKIVIAYDGTDYQGWQMQPDLPTVTGILEKRFESVFKKAIKITAASRTDAGVHALGQVASFSLENEIPEEKLLFAWNNLLPDNVLIRSLERVADEFHPQRNVIEKTYYYHFFQQRPLPFIGRYGYYCGPVNIEKLEQALQIFVGTHDFRSFCTGYDCESTIRKINSIELKHFKRYGVSRIVVRGPGFLRYMIRRIVGACLDIAGSRNRELEELSIALESKNPHQHLYVAPPKGLLLHSIHYK